MCILLGYQFCRYNNCVMEWLPLITLHMGNSLLQSSKINYKSPFQQNSSQFIPPADDAHSGCTYLVENYLAIASIIIVATNPLPPPLPPHTHTQATISYHQAMTLLSSQVYVMIGGQGIPYWQSYNDKWLGNSFLVRSLQIEAKATPQLPCRQGRLVEMLAFLWVQLITLASTEKW